MLIPLLILYGCAGVVTGGMVIGDCIVVDKLRGAPRAPLAMYVAIFAIAVVAWPWVLPQLVWP